jgi:hypothetical protein
MSAIPGSPGFIPGSPGTGSAGTAGTVLSVLLDAALRIAGLLSRPGWTHSDDQYNELVPATNRMLSSWDCDKHKVYNTSIDEYELSAGQKTYTIGPGGDLDNGTAGARPLRISGANIIFPTTPQVRRPVDLLSDSEWRRIAVQDVSGAPPYHLYYDGSIDESGLSNLFLRFQPPAGYILELYTWQRLAAAFTSKSDVAIFPDGYEEAIVYNLAVRAASLNPNEANLAPDARELAARALNTLKALNAKSPRVGCDPALSAGDDDQGGGYGWLDGSGIYT